MERQTIHKLEMELWYN